MVVAIFTSVAKGAFFGKELVIAWKFGASDMLDAFLIAYIVPSFIINLIAGSINAALIPTYIQVRENEGPENAQKLYESATTTSILFLVICAGAVVFSAPFYMRVLASGFDPDKLRLTLTLLYVMSPVMVLSGITTIRSAALNAVEKFALPSLIPMTTPLITVIFIMAGGGFLSIYALALGLVFGQIAETYLLGYVLKRQGIKATFGWHGMDANLRLVIKQFTPMLAGAFIMGSSPLVDQSFAASLPNGNVSLLNYGNKVISFPMYIAATAIGTSVLPYFSSIMAQNDWRTARQMLNQYLKLIFLLAIPAVLLLVIFSEPLVRILLQRGAFTEQDTKITAQVLALGALQIPFYLGGTLITRLISATKANHIFTKIAIVNMIVNIITDYLLMNAYGVAGISLSTSIVYCISFSMLLYSVSVTIVENQSTKDEN